MESFPFTRAIRTRTACGVLVIISIALVKMKDFSLIRYRAEPPRATAAQCRENASEIIPAIMAWPKRLNLNILASAY